MKSTLPWYLAYAVVCTLGIEVFEKVIGISLEGTWGYFILGILCGAEASIGYLMGKLEGLKDDDK